MNTQFVPNEPNAFRADGGIPGPTGRNPVSIRCPHCRELGTFNVLNQAIAFTKRGKVGPSQAVHQYFASIRICPNTKCFGLVFVIEGIDGRLTEIEPPQLLDFNLDNLPPPALEHHHWRSPYRLQTTYAPRSEFHTARGGG
jgi:hypothetical protein